MDVTQHKIFSTCCFLITICVSALLFYFSNSLASWQYINLEIHSTIETLGGISSILIALALFQDDRGKFKTMNTTVATGFVCMGILDTFHAMSPPGDAFIFLHSAASLAGGFFFALIWLPRRLTIKKTDEQRWVAYGAAILSLSVGLRALISPEDVPRILPLYNEKFTLAAILINTSASLLFLASVPKFNIIYRQTKNIRSLLFMFLGLLFGFAEMIFQFSSPWDGIWWSWHLIRLTAFIITLILVVNQYRQLSKKSNMNPHA